MNLPDLALWPRVDWYDLFSDRFTDVFAERAIKPVIFQLLKDVGAPAGASRNRKNWREEIGRYA